MGMDLYLVWNVLEAVRLFWVVIVLLLVGGFHVSFLLFPFIGWWSLLISLVGVFLIFVFFIVLLLLYHKVVFKPFHDPEGEMQ